MTKRMSIPCSPKELETAKRLAAASKRSVPSLVRFLIDRAARDLLANKGPLSEWSDRQGATRA